MMLKQIISIIMFCVIAVALSKNADAHVTLNPDTSEPGSYEKYDVRVPVEKDAHTTKIELKVPKGLSVVGIEPTPLFEHKLKKDKNGNITKITWTATDKGIGPNEFVDLPIQVANPEKEGSFKWNAYQTYDDGETVKWIGDEKAEKPAPVTKVVKNSDTSKELSESSQASNGPIILWIVSIIAIILSLIALFKQKSDKS